MTVTRITALRCHCMKCGHEWIAEEVPGRCAKCKKRTWNRLLGQATVEIEEVEEPVPVKKSGKLGESRKMEMLKVAGQHLFPKVPDVGGSPPDWDAIHARIRQSKGQK